MTWDLWVLTGIACAAFLLVVWIMVDEMIENHRIGDDDEWRPFP